MFASLSPEYQCRQDQNSSDVQAAGCVTLYRQELQGSCHLYFIGYVDRLVICRFGGFDTFW